MMVDEQRDRMSIRARTWRILEQTHPADWAARWCNWILIWLIILNILAVILETIDSLHQRYADSFSIFEVTSVMAFTVEYLLRLWSCVEEPAYANPVVGRLRFMARGMSLVDLTAILPFYLPFVVVDLRFVRILRLFRLVRIAKITRYSSSLRLIFRVLASRKEELAMVVVVMMMVLVISSCLMYYCENSAQPKVFSSIPAAMWWSISTLTTVSYGDAYPITVAGKILSSIIAVIGVGLFALPAGILGAGFIEEIKKHRHHKTVCPHCGKEIQER
jgi:voltage-gated potassium channel